MTDLGWRLLSLLWPVRVARWEGVYQPLELTYEQGRPVVNSRYANQTWGSLHRLWQQVLTKALSGAPEPDRALVIGFGAGSVASILQHELRRDVRITGVEGEPRMLELASRGHRPYRTDRVEVELADAFAWCAKTRSAPFPLVVVDLFVELDVPAPAAEDRFLDDLRRLTATDGLVVFNTIGHDAVSTDHSEQIGRGLRHRFRDVERLDLLDINRVFIAR